MRKSNNRANEKIVQLTPNKKKKRLHEEAREPRGGTANALQRLPLVNQRRLLSESETSACESDTSTCESDTSTCESNAFVNLMQM